MLYFAVIMGVNSKQKGKRGEREAAKLLSKILNTNISRGQQYTGSPESADLRGLEPYGLHPEVKFDESTAGKRLYAAMDQAKGDGQDLTPFVITRRKRENWLIIIEAESLLQFCEKIRSIAQ